ncbi:isoprenoid synthase domain-containing protein [Earliella scabrosa]|nr:isoprenoid synthase domain-containing protein [Earliella scabrosa]
MPRVLHLPRVMDLKWPLPRRISPFYPEVAQESASWFTSFHVFPPDLQQTFDRGNIGLFSALMGPTFGKEEFRAACDYYNFLFAIDDIIDEMDSDVDATSRLRCMVVDALKSPEKERPEGEHVMGEVTRQFWSRAMSFGNSIARHRFIRHMEEYLGAVVEQAKDREEGRTRPLAEYWSMRTLTGAINPSFEFANLIVGGLPEDVIDHPLIRSLHSIISDLILLNNDLVSYNKEQATGDCHNFITVVMHEKSVDLDGALVWLAEEHKRRVDIALDLWPQALALPCETPEVAKGLAFYVDHLMNWPLGFECYSFESDRYFGDERLRAQEERVIELLPGKRGKNDVNALPPPDTVQRHAHSDL